MAIAEQDRTKAMTKDQRHARARTAAQALGPRAHYMGHTAIRAFAREYGIGNEAARAILREVDR